MEQRDPIAIPNPAAEGQNQNELPCSTQHNSKTVIANSSGRQKDWDKSGGGNGALFIADRVLCVFFFIYTLARRIVRVASIRRDS